MSIIRLYNFAKDRNSTKRPTADPVVCTGTFKDAVDLVHPSVLMTDPEGFIQSGYNYCYIPSVGRYYYIDNITMQTSNLALLTLTEDVLATYKTQIGNSSQYVLRSASNYNAQVMDTMYPLLTGKSCDVDFLGDLPWYKPNGYVLADGWYIIGVTNSDTNAVGSTSFYALNEAAFQALRNSLFSSVSWTGMTFQDLEEPLYKSLFNPMQYITSCMWFPTQPPLNGATSITFLDLGFFSAPAFSKTGSQAYRLNLMTDYGSFNLVNHKHAYASTRGIYLNAAPFLTRTLYLPVVGSIELDTSKMTSALAVPTLQWYIDYVSGECRVRVICQQNDGAILGDAVGQLGVNVSLAQQTQDVLGAGVSAIGAAGSAVRGITSIGMGDVSGITRSIEGVASGIASAATSMAPDVTALPGHAALLNGDLLPYDITSFVYPAPDDNAHRGRPLCAVTQLSTLSGYILCSDAHIEISGCLGAEVQMIEQFLNRGFYWE